MMVSFVLSFFPRDVLDEILNLIESVSEDFPSYSFKGSGSHSIGMFLLDCGKAQTDLSRCGRTCPKNPFRIFPAAPIILTYSEKILSVKSFEISIFGIHVCLLQLYFVSLYMYITCVYFICVPELIDLTMSAVRLSMSAVNSKSFFCTSVSPTL